MSTRVNRPYVRQRRVQGGAGGGPAARLAQLAGADARVARPSVERLEPRQMLFSLTITPDSINPQTGLGTIEAAFGYTIPILQATAELGDADAETPVENFDDEPLGGIGSGRIFLEERLVVFHSVANPGANFRIIADRDNEGQVINGTERGEARLRNGESFRFRFLADDSGNPNGARLAVNQFTINFAASAGTNQGISPDSMIVVLRLAGQVVEQYDTAAAIQGAKQPGQSLTNGIGAYTFTTNDPLFPAFDEIEFRATAGSTPPFEFDDVSWTVPPGNFAEIVTSRIFGAFVSFRGPVGSSVQILDLYGRDMIATLALGTTADLQVPLVDLDDNGVPNFNDGIGQIRLSGTDTRTSLRIFGGTVSEGFSDTATWNEGPFGSGRGLGAPADDDGYFNFTLPQSFEGLYGDFEDAGFGFFGTVDDGATGLPPVGGSLVIGAPLFRPLNQFYNPQGGPIGPGAITPFAQNASLQADHGIFILDGSSMGEITTNAALFGSSRFQGAVESLNVGTLFGSVTVEGDLGGLFVATDAGFWQFDPDTPNIPANVDTIQKTGGQLVVGRTLGDLWIGGRSVMDVTVVGDVSNPQTRPPLDQFFHIEREFIFGVNETSQYTVRDYIQDIAADNFLNATGFENAYGPRFRTPILFGADNYRNDLLPYAEFLGSTGTAVQVLGSVGFGDPAVNSAEDPSDVYAFATNGTSPVVLELGGNFATPTLVRVVDVNGNTLAANNTNNVFTDASQRVVFTPTGPGVYYLVVQAPTQTDGDFDGTGLNYSVLVSGIAPTTFGSYYTGARTGGVDANFLSLGDAPTINVLSGNLGFFRAGMASLSGRGTETDPTELTNTTDAIQDLLTLGSIALSVAKGNLYMFMTGSDVEGGEITSQTSIFVSGDLGVFITGQSTLLGLSNEVGDVGLTRLEVGGRVGTVDIRGSIGLDVDDGAESRYLDGLRFRTGTSGGRGDVGLFRVGDDIWGPTSSFQISPGSVVGAFLVSQDAGAGAQGIHGGTPISGFFSTGLGSDVRFVDFPRIDLVGSVNSGLALRVGVPIEIIDDAGATVRITVTGTGNGLQAGFLRLLPINGSEGVAIGQIAGLDLTGRSLLIQTLGAATDGRVSIGRIDLIGADAASTITISGQVELDVWQIVQSGGESGLNSIVNQTPRGDIVAIDVIGLTRLDLTTGSLGRTEVPEWGPQLLGPDLGIAATPRREVGAELGVSAGVIDGNWSNGIFRPANNVNDAAGSAFLDDLGGPFDGFLNGLVVRTGSVTQIRVGGAVGDVILQGIGAVLNELVVNTDNFTPTGAFHGIVGSVYAPNINRVEVGDGLRGDRYAPLTSGSIIAENQILEVTAGTAGRPANIEGRIWAADLANDVNPVGTPLIGRLFVNGGDYIRASIGGGLVDGFWLSVLYDDAQQLAGTIGRVTGLNANFFRSDVTALNINEMTLTGGFYDASSYNALNNAGTITAMGYRNSTLAGTNLEYQPSLILVGADLGTLQTQTLTGDIRDTIVDVAGSITQGITSGFITRSQFGVDNEIPALTVARSIRGSKFTFGRLEVAAVTGSIRHSEFRGNQILSIAAGDSITNSSITVSGPNGRIDLVSAVNTISGSFTATGPIASISTTVGDIDARIVTTTRRGTVGTVSAGRDLILESDISRGLSALIAGRHIGSQADPTVVLVRGNLTTLTAPNGQLYSDIRVGQTLTGTVTIGRVAGLPSNNLVGSGSIVAFGSIGSVVISGDFGGSIVSYTGGIASVAITNGSFLRGSASSPNIIAAYDGDITSLTITGGNLYGDVYADYDLVSLQVVASADGVFGDIGVNPAFTASQSYDAFRNRLPVGVAPSSAVQGPRISAGRNILNVAVTGGSVFEAGFSAGRRIQTISIAESVRNDNATSGFGSFFVAGDTISSLVIGGSARDTVVAAGVLDLGSDNAPGGIGAASDIVKSGTVAAVAIGGDASGVLVLAGVQSGADGVYNTRDDLVALGLSSIGTFTVGGAASDVTLRSDIVSSSAKAGVVVNGGGLKTEDALTAKSNPPGTEITGSVSVNLGGGERATLTFSGPGRAFWSSSTRTLSLVNTTLGSSLVVAATGATLNLPNLVIATNDDASLGSLSITGTLSGSASIVVDGNGTSFTAEALNTTGRIRYGGNLATLRVNSDFRQGHFEAKDVGTVSIGGSFGDPATSLRDEASISVTNATSIDIDGQDRGVIVVAREVNLINVDGAISSALIRVGSRLGQLTAGSMLRTRVSVGDFLGGTNATSGNVGGNQSVQAVRITGNMFDSAIMVGGDLGSDGEIGGSRLAADRVSSGFLGSVFVGGDFQESDIVAGLLRGSDGFFGTSDDAVAAGRSTIGAVTIVGSRVGSNRFTESYRIASTGSLGAVTIAGQPGRNELNFEIDDLELQPVSIQVTDLSVQFVDQAVVATLTFNQPIDGATLNAALSIREIRSNGNVQIFLISGEDYTLAYNAATQSAVVTFSRSVTEANLPITPGRPTLGVHRFVLDQGILRGSLSSARLDGDGDGFARGENYSAASIVGDAGDKLSAGTASIVDSGAVVHTVDFYGPANLDVVLDSGGSQDGLPDVNEVFMLRGFIGDHPDQNVNYFRFAGDTDLYRITLQAGQILRLGAMTGPAQQAVRSVLDANGQAAGAAAVTRLVSADDFNLLANTFQDSYYIRQSGVYYIAVGEQSGVTSQTVPNPASLPNSLGQYAFTVEVFDDFDSGFAADTDSGDGTAIVNAPPASSFTAPGQSITVGDYTFTLTTDALGQPIVVGSNSLGVTSTNSAGVLRSVINSAIGPGGLAGVPNQIFGDIDVFHLNNRAAVTPGSVVRVTLRVSEQGGDLGSKSVDNDFFPTDLVGLVHLGIFDTTTASSATDGSLYFSPSDFTGNGGEPNTIIADNGTASYGFDSNGDFFVQFVAGGRAGPDGQTGTADDTGASYAVYVQGVFNTDYQLEVVTSGRASIVKQTQNIFIETLGGEIDWLETGGLITELDGYDLRALGFTGKTSTGVDVNTFVLQRIVTSLENAFAALGLDVNISTDSSDFEFQPFSTIFLSTSIDPVNLTSNTEYGYSQHSDSLNTDLEDEAVVYLSSFSSLQFTPDDSGLTALSDALTAAVGRRTGELLGLRITADTPNTGNTFDLMAANSPDRLFYPGNSASWGYLQSQRSLSGLFDSDPNNDFLIGVQSSASLLERVLRRN